MAKRHKRLDSSMVCTSGLPEAQATTGTIGRFQELGLEERVQQRIGDAYTQIFAMINRETILDTPENPTKELDHEVAMAEAIAAISNRLTYEQSQRYHDVGNVPLVHRAHHELFLREPRQHERACGSPICEAQLIAAKRAISGDNSAREIRLTEYMNPGDWEAFNASIEETGQPKYPPHPPQCLLCLRKETMKQVLGRDQEQAPFTFLRSTDGLSVRDVPVFLHDHSVIAGNEGEYDSSAVYREQDSGGTGLVGLCGNIIIYSHSDYDFEVVNGEGRISQQRIHFHEASVVRCE